MTEIKVPDEGGDLMTMIDFGEYRSSLFGRTVEYIKEVNQKLPDFQFRDGDVLLSSYPKAGCTWTYEILTMLLRGRAEGPEYSKMNSMLEAIAAENMNSLASPRLLNTHLPYRRIPKDINNKKVKVVFVVRNMKDAAVSLYHMILGMTHYNYSGKFENWLPLYLRGDLAYDSYLKYLRDWEEVYRSHKHDMILLYFEDLKRDTLAEVKKLSAFLELSLSDEVLHEIAEQCQFKHMKTRYTKQMLGTSSYKPEVNYGFMRKGEVGNWKEWFTVAQSELVDKLVDENLKGSQLTFTYQL